MNEERAVGYITSMITEDCVFIWQIGIIPEYQNRGYSILLYDAVIWRAFELGKPLELTIDRQNQISLRAFFNYCEVEGLLVKQVGVCRLTSSDDSFFFLEREPYIV